MTEHQHSSMYRQAAIDSHYMHKYGKVCMLPKVAHFNLFAIIFSVMLMGILFISTQPFFDTVNLNGWVSTTSSNIEVRSQEAAGIVERVYVINGTEVVTGQAIATVNRSQGAVLGPNGIETKQKHITQTQSNRVSIFNQNIANLKVEAKGLEDRYQQTGKQLEALKLHQQTHKHQLTISKKRWQAIKNLAAKGTVTIQQVEQSELQMLTLHQQDFELFMQQQSLQTSLAKIVEQSFKNKQQQSQIQNEKNLAEITSQQELDNLHNDTQFTVYAPNNGVIDNLQVDIGDSVSFNQVLTQIAPVIPNFYVQLAIPSHQVAFLQKDQQVQIKIDGYAYQKYGSLAGIVEHISEQVISPKDISGLSIAANQPVYLVDIKLKDKRQHPINREINLRSGMTVSTSINKQESTILEWFLEPLFDLFRPSFTSEEAA